MIPFWFLPYAIACGNTVLLKPSERVPMTMQKVFELLDELRAARRASSTSCTAAGRRSTRILDHPTIRAISFVGSTPVARHVYARGAATGKRVQCQGGAKNPVVVLPDADMDMTTEIVADCAFGCAGQRCLASSVAITVGEAARRRSPRRCAIAAASRVTGYGLDDGVEMGPVITPESRSRIEGLIDQARHATAPGRRRRPQRPDIASYGSGNFVRPTVLEACRSTSEITRTEIFGPVLLDSRGATTSTRRSSSSTAAPYGNMACLFTTSGAERAQVPLRGGRRQRRHQRRRRRADGLLPVQRRKESFFGDLHGQGRDAIEFYTQKKVVVERWPKDWSRKF